MCCAPVLYPQTNNWNYFLAENEASLVSMHEVHDSIYVRNKYGDNGGGQCPNFYLNPLTPQRHPSRLSFIACKTGIYFPHRTSCSQQPALRLILRSTKT